MPKRPVELVGHDAIRYRFQASKTFIPVDSGLYLYFPERSQQQLKLRAFIDMARVVAARVYG